jgi:hypothetical protein
MDGGLSAVRRAGQHPCAQLGGMQFQRLLEGGVGLLFLTHAQPPQTDEVMRVGLTHPLAGLFIRR